MTVRILSVLAVSVLLARGVSAQTDARPEDVSTLDGILRAYYEVVSGPAGSIPDRARDHTLHRPGALVAIAGVDADGSPTLFMGSLDDYHDRFGGPRPADFYETEIHREVMTFGNMTHVWSTYAYRASPDGPITGRGINSIQLYNDGRRWWITSWIFDSERPGNRIPAEYLPGGR